MEGKTNLKLSIMDLAFEFARKIYNIGFVDVRLRGKNGQLILRINRRDLHACNPIVGFYEFCISHQRARRVSNVSEYLYFSLMYKSPIHKYLDDMIEFNLLRERPLKHKSIASFVDRLDSIFTWYKFNLTLRLEPIPGSGVAPVVRWYQAGNVTMRFNYLNRIVTELYTNPNTTIKISMYLLLLR